MDTKRVRSMEELKDSRLLFDKQPPAFGFFFLLFISTSLLLLLAWSMKAPKVFTIQTQGVVTNEEANYMMCTYTGEIYRRADTDYTGKIYAPKGKTMGYSGLSCSRLYRIKYSTIYTGNHLYNYQKEILVLVINNECKKLLQIKKISAGCKR